MRGGCEGGGLRAALSAEGGRYPELSAVLRAAQRASVPSSARLKHTGGGAWDRHQGACVPSSGASLTAVGRGGVGGSGASVSVRVGGSACGGSAWKVTKRKQNGVDKRACAADVRTHTCWRAESARCTPAGVGRDRIIKNA